MYAWAMDSLPLELARRVIFICLEEHLREPALENDIRNRYGALDPEIVRLDEVTEGQACTVLKARQWIDNDEPLLIYNADTYCRTSLAKRLPELPPQVDGLLGVFHAPGDKWSFARADADGRVLETAEKSRISDWASTGLYYFRRGRDFVAPCRGDDRRRRASQRRVLRRAGVQSHDRRGSADLHRSGRRSLGLGHAGGSPPFS